MYFADHAVFPVFEESSRIFSCYWLDYNYEIDGKELLLIPYKFNENSQNIVLVCKIDFNGFWKLGI